MKSFILISICLFGWISLSSAAEVSVENATTLVPPVVEPLLNVAPLAVDVAAPVPAVEQVPIPAPVPVGTAAQPQLKGQFVLDGAVYQIYNKLDGGVLTASLSSGDSTPVYDRTNTGSAGQKWRLEAASTALLGKSYRIVPTVNEKAVLDLDLNTLGIFGRLAAFGNQRYWKIIRMGEGVVEIRNFHKTHYCLTSFGLDQEINTAKCQNSPAQQWILTLL